MLRFQARIAQQLLALEYGDVLVGGQVFVQLASQSAEVELDGWGEDFVESGPVFVVVAFGPFERDVAYGEVILVRSVSRNGLCICTRECLPGVEISTDILDIIWMFQYAIRRPGSSELGSTTRGKSGNAKAYEHGKCQCAKLGSRAYSNYASPVD